MADSNFDILIRILAQQVGTEKAQDILKKVREETTLTGKEGVKQEEMVEAATKRTFASKKQLKDLLREVGREFPLLGRAGMLAINPIAFSAAALTGAFVIFKKNLEAIKQSFSGFDAGNITDLGEVNKLAAAYEKLSQAVGGLGTNLDGLKKKLADNQELIATNAKFFRGLGLDVGTGPEELSQALTGDAALRLYQSGSAKVASGSNISPEALASLKEQADAAEKQMAIQKERRQWLSEFKSGQRSQFAFSWRYGADATMSDAERAESATEGQAEAAIGRYRTARDRSALRTQGLAELSESESMARSNLSARRATFAGSADELAAAGKQLQNADLMALPRGIAELLRAWNDILRLLEKSQQDAKALRARLDNNSQRP